MPIIEQVIIEDTAPASHAEAVASAFRRSGLDVQVEAVYGRRSADVLPWIVRIVVEGTLLGFFGALGADGYAKFKRLVRDIQDARRGAGNGTGSIDISDSEHTHLVLHNSLPDEALDALRNLDWSEKRGDYLIWRDERGEWEHR